MSFTRIATPDAFGFSVIAGVESGLDRLLVVRGRLPAREVGAAHVHEGDEVIIVVTGRLRMLVGDEMRVCEPGDVAVVPGGVWHGFIVQDEVVVDVIGEQAMGSFYATPERVEVHRRGVPWDREPPDGESWTDEATMAGIAERAVPDVRTSGT